MCVYIFVLKRLEGKAPNINRLFSGLLDWECALVFFNCDFSVFSKCYTKMMYCFGNYCFKKYIKISNTFNE